MLRFSVLTSTEDNIHFSRSDIGRGQCSVFLSWHRQRTMFIFPVLTPAEDNIQFFCPDTNRGQCSLFLFWHRQRTMFSFSVLTSAEDNIQFSYPDTGKELRFTTLTPERDHAYSVFLSWNQQRINEILRLWNWREKKGQYSVFVPRSWHTATLSNNSYVCQFYSLPKLGHHAMQSLTIYRCAVTIWHAIVDGPCLSVLSSVFIRLKSLFAACLK